MEFVVDHERFHRVITQVSSVVSSRTTIPILSGIKIKAEEDRLIVVGSNSEVVLVKEIPLHSEGKKVLEVKQRGEIVLGTRYLSPLVKKLSEDISFSVQHHVAHIRSGDVKTRLSGMNPDDYPNLPELRQEQAVTVDGKAFNEMLQQTVFAASTNQSRPLLTGVHFSYSNDHLKAVATNSHRLSMRHTETNAGGEGNCTVPASSLVTLSKLINKQSGELSLYIDEHFISFSQGSTTLYSRLLEGTYPNVSSLIPNESKLTISLDTKKLYEAVDRACLFASDWRHNNIRMRLKDDSELSISSRTDEMGDISEKQVVTKVSGDAELDLYVDGQFLKEALAFMDDEETLLSFGGAMRPIVIKPKSHSSYIQLISPVRSY
ncbi:DNA polymerase III subunit beta [Halobacillus litoralis]|uniref:DNA polymerase III subunit beta n=1 Tax=Halobacillus litoralis TaxID=45668 RepID=UPI001CD63B1C|nr:DNA polymerase III subunit beta [Halobacillus litoralis]MCA0969309.1 DNA polymerase III subunit beta [Halobacillus litoralis]